MLDDLVKEALPLFAKWWNTDRLAHADAQNLCAGACSLSKPWWLISSLLSDKGRRLSMA